MLESLDCILCCFSFVRILVPVFERIQVSVFKRDKIEQSEWWKWYSQEHSSDSYSSQEHSSDILINMAFSHSKNSWNWRILEHHVLVQLFPRYSRMRRKVSRIEIDQKTILVQLHNFFSNLIVTFNDFEPVFERLIWESDTQWNEILAQTTYDSESSNSFCNSFGYIKTRVPSIGWAKSMFLIL